MSYTEYLLPKHVFVCHTDDYYVFLDIKQDKYSCLDVHHALGLSALLGAHSGPSVITDAAAAAHPELNEMLSIGLLTTHPDYGRPPRLTRSSPVRSALLDHPEATTFDRVRFFDVANFARSALGASAALKRLRLDQLVSRVLALRQSVDPKRPFDVATSRRAVKKFMKLRPLFPRPYLCMFDSLALLTFLSRIGIYPRWIFGVRTRPFYAHCWVQSGDIVFNDTTDHINSLTPILEI